jgi:hypothetical protein
MKCNAKFTYVNGLTDIWGHTAKPNSRKYILRKLGERLCECSVIDSDFEGLLFEFRKQTPEFFTVLSISRKTS